MTFTSPWIAGLALAAAIAPQTAPTARQVVERQLAKPAPAEPPRMTAEEAAAIRAAYLKSIGSAPRSSGTQGVMATSGETSSK